MNDNATINEVPEMVAEMRDALSAIAICRGWSLISLHIDSHEWEIEISLTRGAKLRISGQTMLLRRKTDGKEEARS